MTHSEDVMGGQTQSKNTTSFQNQATNQTGSSQLATAPWAGNEALLRRLYAQLGGIGSDVTPPETGALDRLGTIGAAGNAFAPAIGNEWTRPRLRNFREQCCDCGLIHRLDFRLVDGRIEFRTRRDNRATAAARRRLRGRDKETRLA